MLSAWWFYAAGAVFTAWLVVPAVSPSTGAFSGFVAVGLVSLLVAPYFNLWMYSRTTDWSYARTLAPWFYALTGAVTVSLALRLVGAPPPGGTLGTVAIAVAVFAATLVLARRVGAALTARVLRVSDPTHALELAELCDGLLAADGLDERRRAALELSLSGALAALSSLPGEDDHLPVAFAILDDALETAPPGQVLAVALSLLEAMEAKWERTGDRVGYDAALALVMEAGELAHATDRTARSRALAARGQSHARRGHRALAEGSQDEAGRLLAAAAADRRAALAAAPADSDERALHTLALAAVEGPRPLGGDLDASIARCRGALRRLRLTGSEALGAGQLVLADLLELRARLQRAAGSGRRGVAGRLGPARGSYDAARALRLCLGLSMGVHAREARRRIPGLRAFLLEGLRLGGDGVLQGWMYRRLFEDQSGASSSGAIEAAATWAAWATERGDPRQAADAWQAWVTAVGADLRRRVLHDKQQRLPRLQPAFAVAAHWLIRAGRTRDAAMALETGRAVLLTGRIHRRHADLGGRLRDAGEHELAERWLQATEELDAHERAAYGPAAAEEEPWGYASAEYFALAEHDALVRAIAALPGFSDVQPVTTYEHLRAAAAEGPILYLASVAETGFGVVVGAGDEPPRAVELPALARDEVERLAALVAGATHPLETARVFSDLLPRLWTDAVAPLVGDLAPGSLVTLVPAGRLGELPLHAAGSAPDPGGVWRDRPGAPVLRYAPNARMLLAAQHAARSGGAGRMLSAAVADADGLRELPFAEREADELSLRFGGTVDRPRPATVAAVARGLDACDVWHFACHGRHEPDRPLESRLVLADGTLRLAELFARPHRSGRLAVLSACQTARAGAAAPDEVVAFPSALLAAGVAAVISCQGEVEDEAATLLVLAFFAQLERLGPARALAAAQAWLRSATNAELHAAYPRCHPRPGDAPVGWDEDRPFATPATWALFNCTGA